MRHELAECTRKDEALDGFEVEGAEVVERVYAGGRMGRNRKVGEYTRAALVPGYCHIRLRRGWR